ncbi:hypothetical protein OAF42_01525 [Planctomicrobium sp.]|nr:hypothetical protein [Planctomicrobium sp.]MDB4733101.1 hypothetical protein [Planctomicrobium sp.]
MSYLNGTGEKLSSWYGWHFLYNTVGISLRDGPKAVRLAVNHLNWSQAAKRDFFTVVAVAPSAVIHFDGRHRRRPSVASRREDARSFEPFQSWVDDCVESYPASRPSQLLFSSWTCG